MMGFRRYLSVATAAFLLVSCGAARNFVTVKGTVTDASTGRPLSGVVVSDGVHCTVTDAAGRYGLTPDKAFDRFVFVVTPEGYDSSFGENCTFDGYFHVDTTVRSDRCDFALTPAGEDADRYTMLLMGDPQVMSVRPHSLAAWDWTAARLKGYADANPGSIYQIMLGDMVVNEIEVPGKAEHYLDGVASTGIRTMHVPGNHDHIQSARTYRDAISGYARHFGPYNYALNIGKVHYIFFDSMLWKGEKGHRYDEGVPDEFIGFLREDLSHVPADRPVMICTHCPLTKEHGGRFPREVVNYDKLMEVLAGRDVCFWYGHIHFNSFYSYTPEELSAWAPGVRSLSSNIVARPCGSWACSGPVGRDGAPRGMLVMDVDGTQCRWSYHSLDPDYPDDFNVIYPGTFKGEGIADDSAIYCNVYVWDNAWGLPELWVDGVRAGTFEHCVSENYPSAADPLYSHCYPIWKAYPVTGFRDEYPRDYDNNHLFKIIPPEGARSGEIRLRDRWGRLLTRTLKW